MNMKPAKNRMTEAQFYKTLPVVARGDRKHTKASMAQRAKYGVSRCDTYNLDCSLGLIISNALYAYAYHAGKTFSQEDRRLIERHAKAIREYAEADTGDNIEPIEYTDKEYERDMAAYKSSKNTELPLAKPNKAVRRKHYSQQMKAYVAYKRKKEAWKEAMEWLTESWEGLWY